MGWWDDFTGKTGAEAATNAAAGVASASKAGAADTYGKQQSAIGRLLGYGDEYKSGTDANAAGYDRFIGNYQPYVDSGHQANGALQTLMSNPESVRSLPGYQFAQSEGVKALDRGAAAHHMLDSGRGSKDLLRFGTGLADQTYGNQWQRLLGLSQQGLGATGAQAGVGGQQIGLQQQGLTGQMGARTTAYGGDMNSAGTVGAGDVAAANATSAGALAAANARASGSQNLFNGATKLGGMALGAFGGGMPSWMGGGGSSYGDYTIQGYDSAGNPNYGRS